MSKMIERVAKAIFAANAVLIGDEKPARLATWERDAPAGSMNYEVTMREARAAIEAMREPTGEMRDIGRDYYSGFLALWQDMIDDALREKVDA
jgi:hypothetical protein